MITPKQYAEIFNQLLQEVGEEKENEAIGSFVGLLQKNNDLRLADKIIEKYQEIGVEKIRITSARKLSSEIKERLQKSGEIQEKIDESLIGGAKIRIGDTLIDGSIKRTLENLRSALIK